jgi:hypothetical protein
VRQVVDHICWTFGKSGLSKGIDGFGASCGNGDYQDGNPSDVGLTGHYLNNLKQYESAPAIVVGLLIPLSICTLNGIFLGASIAIFALLMF